MKKQFLTLVLGAGWMFLPIMGSSSINVKNELL